MPVIVSYSDFDILLGSMEHEAASFGLFTLAHGYTLTRVKDSDYA
jgi:hypothetical protein